jgi:outer membrane protein
MGTLAMQHVRRTRGIFAQNSVVLGLLVVLALSGPARAETLRNAMADAYRNSSLLEQNRFLLRVEDEGVAQAVAQLRPVLTFLASANHDLVGNTTTTTAGLVAEWTLYAGGSRRLSLEAARETVLATRQGLVSVEQQVLLDAATAYLNIWRDLQIVDARAANVRVVTQQLRAARDRLELGEITATEVAQAETRLAEARASLASAQGQLAINRELFLLAVGREPGSLSGPGALPDLPASEAAADALARQNTPTIRQLQHEARVADLAVEGARASYRPTISLEGQFTETFQAPTPNAEGESASIGLSLSMPIFRGGQLGSVERQAIAQASATRSALLQQVRVNVQIMGVAWSDYRIAGAQIASARQRIASAEVALEGVRQEADLGVRTTLDVFDAEQDLLDARINLIEAQTSLFAAAYSVLSAAGMLTVGQLGLDVPSFDPSTYADTVSGAPVRVPSVQGQRLDRILERIGRD